MKSSASFQLAAQPPLVRIFHNLFNQPSIDGNSAYAFKQSGNE